MHGFLCFDISVSCQCSTQEFYLITSTLSRLSTELQALMPAIQSQLSSALLKHLLLDTPQLLSPAHNFLKVLDEKAAKCVKSFDNFKNIVFFHIQILYMQYIKQCIWWKNAFSLYVAFLISYLWNVSF